LLESATYVVLVLVCATVVRALTYCLSWLSLVGLLFVSLVSCGPRENFLSPLHRFPDPVDGGQAPVRVTVADDTRPVLAGHSAWTVIGGQRFQVPADLRIPLVKELPEDAARLPRLVLEPRIGFGGRWRSLRPVLALRGHRETMGVLETEIEVPPSLAGKEVQLVLVAHALDRGHSRRRETRPVEVPAGSILEFGTAILEPAYRQGPVRFRVSTCVGGECAPIHEAVMDPADPAAREWRDHAVPIPGPTRELSFRFDTELLEPRTHAFSLAVWSAPTLYVSTARPAEASNILLVSLDTLRADHLGTYGYPHDTAPFLRETFDGQGYVFEQMVASAATTGPAHMTLFTSFQPYVHGVGTGIEGKVLSPGIVTLAEALRAGGFQTGAFTENAAIQLGVGFERGFESYAEDRNPVVNRQLGEFEKGIEHTREWLQRNRGKRFFFFLHTYQVHGPYTPPEAYADLFPDPPAGYEPSADVPARYDPALYDREIRYTDDLMRRLFDVLREEGLAENTVVVVTSDHGEEFLDHGYLGHGSHVHAEITHIPLMFWGAGIPKGERFERPVGHVDVMPTLLEMSGLPVPDGLMGKSFAQVFTTDDARSPFAARPLFSEAWYPFAKSAPGEHLSVDQPTLAVRVGDQKLIRFKRPDGFAYEMYDLAEDPREQADLYNESPPELSRLQELLDAYPDFSLYRREQLEREDGSQPAGGGGALDARQAEREEKLRALGYID